MAEVKFTMRTGDYQDLIALLKYHATKITQEQFRVMLVARGYKDPGNQNGLDQQIAFLAEQALISLES